MTELSIHCQELNPQIVEIVRNSDRLRYIKVVNPPHDDPFPGKRTIARIWTPNEGAYTAFGASGAQRWWEVYGHWIEERPWMWGVEVADNEPVVQTNEQIGIHNAYQVEWINQLHRRNLPQKTLGGGWARGCPEPEDAAKFLPIIEACDYPHFHEYWFKDGPMGHDLEGRPIASWHTWRFHQFYHWLLYGTSIRTPPITFITECGMAPGDPRGYNSEGVSEEEYIGQCREYRSQCAKYLYVEAAFVFTSGGGHRWRNFEVSPDMFRRMIVDNEVIEPEPEPTSSIVTPSFLPRAVDFRPPMKNLEKAWYSADEVFGWYNGHPEHCRDWNLEAGGNSDLGEPLVTPFAGFVITADRLDTTEKGWGSIVRILGMEPHGGLITWKGAHLNRIRVKPGEIVRMGQPIGEIGNTGTTWAHLHESICVGYVPMAQVHAGLSHMRHYFPDPAKFYVEHGVDAALMERLVKYDGR